MIEPFGSPGGVTPAGIVLPRYRSPLGGNANLLYAASLGAGVAGSGIGYAINTLFAIPYIQTPNSPPNIDRLNANVQATGGAGSVFRLGLYDTDPVTQLPRNLIVDGLQEDGTVVALHQSVVAAAFPGAGLYWLVYLAGIGAPNIQSWLSNSSQQGGANPIFGYTAANPALEQHIWSIAFAYGALPAAFPAGGAPLAASQIPWLAVRYV
jgi:hypothetical protein